MTELLVYAPGIRQSQKLLQFSHQMDLLAVRYKVDAAHDLVFFDIDDPDRINVKQINDMFENVGLRPRFVGQIPTALKSGQNTEKLSA